MKKTMIINEYRIVRFADGKTRGANVYHVTAVHDANGTIRNFIETMHVWTGTTRRNYLSIRDGLSLIKEMTASA